MATLTTGSGALLITVAPTGAETSKADCPQLPTTLPELVETKPYRVDVETASELTRGRTVVDRYAQTRRPPNADVGLRIDRERFIDVLIEAVRTVGAGG